MITAPLEVKEMKAFCASIQKLLRQKDYHALGYSIISHDLD